MLQNFSMSQTFSKFLNGFVKVDTWVSLSCYMDVEATGSVPAEFVVQISGLKMKAEFIKIFKLFEELEEAGECATLTISSKGGTSSIKLLLESPSSFSQLPHGRIPCHQLLEFWEASPSPWCSCKGLSESC